MYVVELTDHFNKWLNKLTDKTALARILARLRKAENGNLGDIQSVGDKLFEIRIFYGPGYRLYFAKKGDTIILLINGGDKSTQSRDIKKAKELLKELEIDND